MGAVLVVAGLGVWQIFQAITRQQVKKMDRMTTAVNIFWDAEKPTSAELATLRPTARSPGPVEPNTPRGLRNRRTHRLTPRRPAAGESRCGRLQPMEPLPAPITHYPSVSLRRFAASSLGLSLARGRCVDNAPYLAGSDSRISRLNRCVSICARRPGRSGARSPGDEKPFCL